MKNLLLTILLFILSFSAFSEFSHSYIKQHPLKRVAVNAIEIAYRKIGDEDSSKVLLIMGLGASNTVHGDSIVRGLENSGYQILVFDNRDTGGSTRFDDWGQPTIWFQLLKHSLRLPVNAPYSLDDMAADTAALMDATNFDKAHVVGFSMGGMIAQKLAAQYPEKVSSLTSIMSTTFARHLPPPTKAARNALTNFASGKVAKERSKVMLDRGFYPDSMPRQMMAIYRSGDRSSEVKSIKVDTLVIHGKDDELVLPSHGEHTASLIENSKFIVFDGMGHNIPGPVLPKLIAAMTEHMGSVDKANAIGFSKSR